MARSLATPEISGDDDGVFVFVRTSYTGIANIGVSQEYRVWATDTEWKEEKLTQAFDTKKPVYLMFASAAKKWTDNTNKNLYGMALMTGKPDNKSAKVPWMQGNNWRHPFPVTWIYQCRNPLPTVPIELTSCNDVTILSYKVVIDEVIDLCQKNCGQKHDTLGTKVVGESSNKKIKI